MHKLHIERVGNGWKRLPDSFLDSRFGGWSRCGCSLHGA